jgi:E3 ubiquitin-protein ligase DMA1/2
VNVCVQCQTRIRGFLRRPTATQPPASPGTIPLGPSRVGLSPNIASRKYNGAPIDWSSFSPMYSSVPSPPQQWHPGPAAPTLDSSRPPLPASPTSPTRSGRLRGLSYLRSYTQTHILSRDSHNNNNNSNSNSQRPSTLARATSYPSPTSTSRGSAPATPQPAPQNNPRQTSPTAQRSTTDLLSARSSTQENIGSTSGWLPTVGGQSGVSRIATEPQSTATESSSAVLSGNSESAVTSDLTASMARTRPAVVAGATEPPQVDGGGDSQPNGQNGTVNGASGAQGMAHQLPSIRFCAHQDPRAQRPSLVFSPMSRILPTGKEVIKVGRYSERDNQPPQAANAPSAAPVGFKSKVVSRRHCEFWCAGGRWFIKDVKSSSGTFLNHIRLSSPGTESRPFPINDGDIVQLGIDFKGGEEMIFRCVKIRVELNKGWQNGPSSFKSVPSFLIDMSC